MKSNLQKIGMLILTLLVSLSANAYDFEVDGIVYNILSATSFTCEVAAHLDSSKKVVEIPQNIEYRNREFSVIQIGTSAFLNSEIETITLPITIKTIESSAFEGSKISKIEFPDELEEIKERAFYNTQLASIKLDFTGECNIGRNAFSECLSLKEITIGSNVILYQHNYGYDGDRAYGVFRANPILTKVNFEGDMKVLPGYTFADCPSIFEINILGRVDHIEGFAWTETIETLNVLGTVYDLGHSASIVVPFSIPCVQLNIEGTVKNCYGSFTSSLKKVDLSGSIKYLGGFIGCDQIESIVMPNTVTTIEGFKGCSLLSHLILSDSISKLEDKMFDECISLKELSIPSNVKSMATRSTAWGAPDPLIPLELTSLMVKANHKDNMFSIGSTKLSDLCPLLETLVLERNIYDGNDSYNNNLNVLTNFKYLTKLDLVNITEPIEIGNLPLLKSIILRDTIPPTIRKSSFTNEQIMDVEVLVPLGYKDVYVASQWGDFWNISELPEVKAEYIVLSSTSQSINVGDTFLLSAIVYPDNTSDKSLIWHSSNDDIAIVSENGLITGKSSGTVTITAICGDVSASCEITVVNPVIDAEQIVLNVEKAELNIGEYIQLEATVLPEDTTDKTLEWKSSDEEIAIVDETGLVTALKEGTAIITVSCGEASAQCEITVLEEDGVEGILANPNSEITIYSIDGSLVKKGCKVEHLNTLEKGIYIIVSGKDRYKIAL